MSNITAKLQADTGAKTQARTATEANSETGAATRPLFTAYPQLSERLPQLALADLPTPVQPLPALAANAWIKRDDLSHAEYGGNKIRKLEFILAEARARGADHIITFGATGSNHGVATAMLCQRLGLRCTVLLFHQAVTATVRNNLQLMHGYGAELDYRGSLAATVARFYLHPHRLNSRSYFLFAGGSNTAGTLGFVNAALELKQQIDSGLCPQPRQIYVAVGSSATLAGLTIGCQLAGLVSEVVGIRVAPSHLGPFAACTEASVATLMRRTARHLQRAGLDCATLPRPRLVDDYYGEGYGLATDAGARATERFAAQGLTLEQTYSAKAAAAFLDALEDSREPLLYWHTYNSRPAPAARLQQPLPPRLAALLD